MEKQNLSDLTDEEVNKIVSQHSVDLEFNLLESFDLGIHLKFLAQILHDNPDVLNDLDDDYVSSLGNLIDKIDRANENAADSLPFDPE